MLLLKALIAPLLPKASEGWLIDVGRLLLDLATFIAR